jgi:hypothetical protein
MQDYADETRQQIIHGAIPRPSLLRRAAKKILNIFTPFGWWFIICFILGIAAAHVNLVIAGVFWYLAAVGLLVGCLRVNQKKLPKVETRHSRESEEEEK